MLFLFIVRYYELSLALETNREFLDRPLMMPLFNYYFLIANRGQMARHHGVAFQVSLTTGEFHKSHHPNMHSIQHYSNSSNDETKDCFVAQFVASVS